MNIKYKNQIQDQVTPSKFHTLRVLDISRNNIDKVPATISACVSLVRKPFKHNYTFWEFHYLFQCTFCFSIICYFQLKFNSVLLHIFSLIF